MPVQFRRDELLAAGEEPAGNVVWEAQTGSRFAGLGRGLCSALWVSIPGAAGLWCGLALMKPTLEAAAALSSDSGFWRETGLSLLLFCFYGVVLGGATAWRVTSTASLAGLATWLAAGGNVLLVALTGVIVSRFCFTPGDVPWTCWFGLGGLTGSAFLGIWLFNAWND
jgi:hypothetical protein